MKDEGLGVLRMLCKLQSLKHLANASPTDGGDWKLLTQIQRRGSLYDAHSVPVNCLGDHAHN